MSLPKILKAVSQSMLSFFEVILGGLGFPLKGVKGRGFKQFPGGPAAYEDYAVQAFNLDAVDYLLKPVSGERLEAALQRAARRPGENMALDLEGPKVTRPREEEQNENKARLLEKLPVEKENKTLLIDLSEIRFAVARGDYVYIKIFDREYLTRFSLSELEKRLPSPPFMRTHRAFLVNLKNVSEISPFFNGAWVLKVNDMEQSEVQVSRGHARNLRSLLGM